MRLIVTGGAGFIGSAVVRLAVNRGYQVLNIDKLSYASNLKNLSEICKNDNYAFAKVDICDYESLKTTVINFRPQFVLHLAAESHVDRSIKGPKEFINTNILGTYNLLEIVRDYWDLAGRPEFFRFHHVSTDEVFGSLELESNKKFSEITSYDPRSPYSASKACSDHLVRAWNATYGLPVVITNCSNNYGPYHFPEKLIPLVITNALMGKPIPVYGDGSNVRDWLHVSDHADALLKVLTSGKDGETYLIGGNSERTNLNLVREICSILDEFKPSKNGSYNKLIQFVSDRLGHDERYAIDAGKISDELGWTPKIDLCSGLRSTVKWYIENEDWWSPLLNRAKF